MGTRIFFFQITQFYFHSQYWIMKITPIRPHQSVASYHIHTHIYITITYIHWDVIFKVELIDIQLILIFRLALCLLVLKNVAMQACLVCILMYTAMQNGSQKTLHQLKP